MKSQKPTVELQKPETQSGKAALSTWLWRLCVVAAAMTGLAMLCCVAFTGPVPQILFGHDTIALLDGAWRWHCGVLPHRDYYSPTGSLSYLLVAIGMTLGGSPAQAMPAAMFLVGALVLALSLYGAFTRMPPLPAALATVVILAATIAPHELRFESTEWSYAGIYNRWGYGLLCVTLLLTVVRPAGCTRWQDAVDGAIAGFCACLLIFLKISYGGLAVGLLAVQAVLFAKQWRRQIGTLAGFLACLAGFGFLLHWPVRGFVGDMTMAFHARQNLGAKSLFDTARYLRGPLVLLALFAAVNCVAVPLLKKDGFARRLWQSAVWLGLVAGFSVLVVMTNSPLGNLVESPLPPLGCLVYAGWILQDAGSAGTKSRVAKWRLWVVHLAVWPGLLFAVIPVTGRNLASLEQAAKFKKSGETLPADQTFGDGPLRGMEIMRYGGDSMLPTSYVGKVNDGMGLLRQTGNLQKRVLVLDFANPFDLLRQAQPCRGSPLVWQLGFVFSDRFLPPLATVFEGAEAVLIPRQFGDGNQENLRVLAQHYGAYLQEHFALAGQSQQWVLFAAKTPATR